MKWNQNKPMLVGGVAAFVLVGAMAAKGPTDTGLLQPGAVPPAQMRLAKGTQAPLLRLATVQGDSLRLADLRGGESILVFVTPTCPYCRELKTEVLARELPDLDGRLVFVTRSVVDTTAPTEIVDLEGRVVTLYPVAVDTSGASFEAYRAQGVPTAYLIDEDGRVSASATGVEGGLALIDRLVGERRDGQLSALEHRP